MPAYKDEKTKKWYCQFYCKNWKGENKHIVKRGFEKKKDALDYERNFKNTEKYQDVLFEELIEEYRKKMMKKVRATTYHGIDGVITNHFLPFFKGMRISSITPQIINKWHNHMHESKNKKGEPLAPSTLSIINSRLNSIFKFACRLYGLTKNPVSNLDPIGSLKSRKKMNILTPEQFNQLVNTFSNITEITLLKTLFWSGCRIGEALALTPADILFNAENHHPALRINKTIVKVKGEIRIHPPKTIGSNRITPIPRFLYDDLQYYMTKLCGLTETSQIFSYTSRYAIGHKVIRHAEKIGLPRIRLHDLRHSYVSLLLSKTKDIPVVAECIGDNINTTLSTYTHLLPNQKEKAVANLEEFSPQKVHTIETTVSK